MPEWKEIVTLEKSNPVIEDFGLSQVSGNHIIVSDANNVYIYERITKGNKWELKYTHTNVSPENNESAVSISGKNAIACNVDDTNPSVYFYQKNNKGNWEIYQTLDPITEEWGGVSISGNYAAIVMRNPTASTGECRIFSHNTKANRWELDRVIATSIDIDDDVGTDLPSISGNYLALADAAGAGTLEIYIENPKGNNWNLDKTLTGDTVGDLFGTGFQISGNNLIVAAPGAGDDGGGEIYIYERSAKDKNWHRVFNFTDPDDASAYDSLGLVSISGNFAMAGAPEFGSGGLGSSTGKIYFFQKKNDGKWYNIQSKIGVGAEGLGGWVSISGNFALAAAVNNTADQVYVYEFKF